MTTIVVVKHQRVKTIPRPKSIIGLVGIRAVTCAMLILGSFTSLDSWQLTGRI